MGGGSHKASGGLVGWSVSSPICGAGRAGPRAREGQSKPCAAAKPGQDSHRAPISGPLRHTPRRSYSGKGISWCQESSYPPHGGFPLSCPAQPLLGAPTPTASSTSCVGISPWATMGAEGTRVPILPPSSTRAAGSHGTVPCCLGRGVYDEGVGEQT